MVPTEDLSLGQPRLLTTDNPLHLPHGEDVRLLITGADVLHSWAVPALGLKMDATPGRLNQTSTHILWPGRFYRQCSELCGVNHSFMPVEVVSGTPEESVRSPL